MIDELKKAFAHHAISEGLPITKKDTDKLAELASKVMTNPKKKHFVKCSPINGYGCDCVDKCNFHIY